MRQYKPSRHIYSYPTILPGDQALGFGDLSDSDAEQSSLAASVNRATYETALRLVPAPAREGYERRGQRLHFVPDRRAAEADLYCAAPAWLIGCHSHRNRWCGSRNLQSSDMQHIGCWYACKVHIVHLTKA